MSQFLDSIKEVKKNYKVYDEWEQQQADDVSKREYLAKTLDLPKDKVELTKAKAKVVLRAADILDKRSENNCENMEQTVGLITLIAMVPFMFVPLLPSLLNKKGKNISAKLNNTIIFGALGLESVAAIGLILWGNSKQKEASRIGRFQAKQHELKDLSNFVIYTPEQIEAAKIIAKNIPDKKDVKSISKLLQDMKQMSQDKVAYKKWLQSKIKNPDDVNKILNARFTKEQLAQGEEDKEIIVNIVKDINMKAEAYSENTENAFETLGALSFIGAPLLGFLINKILKPFSKMSPNIKAIVSFTAPILFSLGVLMQGTAEQKQAAQVGRFMKKKEILNNPEVIMSYTDENLKQADGIKAQKQKKSFFGGITDDFTFLNKYLKERKEYIKYSKNQGKEDEKLYDALKQTEVSEEQLKEAKHLQKNVFNSFDKVDEMSQRYSEDIETGSELAKQGFSFIWSVFSTVALAVIPVLVAIGKFPIHKIVKAVSNIVLDKNSSLRKMIDDAYQIINKDKDLKETISKAVFDKKERQNILKNEKLRLIFEELKENLLSKLPEIYKQDSSSDIKKIIDKEFKQDAISKWARNLILDILKFVGSKKIKASGAKLPEDVDKKLKFNYQNYKTLVPSAIIGGLPLLTFMTAPAFAFNSWLTNIQKKAGRIGIMKAMEEIDKPQLFVKQDDENSK